MTTPRDDSEKEPPRAYDRTNEYRAAIRGERLPGNMDGPCERLSIIYGIRHRFGFASGLRGLPAYPDFTRALNARSIMSNIIPNMDEPYEFPYCIWHPDVASEDTYRALAARYPHMRYQVGRACAVAGYTELYHSLELLPEVSIAEEARDSGAKGQAIFDSIMASPYRHAVMDDYTRSVNLDNPQAPAFLNCDTAVHSSIDVPEKSSIESLANLETSGLISRPYFDITECRGICHYKLDFSLFDKHTNGWYAQDTTTESKDLATLLCSPLPADLPNVNKDLLILVAAYSGDIDRYARLRRPMMLDKEWQCLVHGIYHNTMFAKWWSQQSEAFDIPWLQSAINARFIMNNDLSRITQDTPDEHIPLLIHRPKFADRFTYEELARRKAFMTPHCALVCIIADYQDTYDRLQARPEISLVSEARRSRNPYYLKDLLERAAKLDINVEQVNKDDAISRQFQYLPPSQPTQLLTNICASDIIYVDDDANAASQADIGLIEVFLCPPESSLHGVFTDEVYEKQCRSDGMRTGSGMPNRLYPQGRGTRGRGRGRGRGS